MTDAADTTFESSREKMRDPSTSHVQHRFSDAWWDLSADNGVIAHWNGQQIQAIMIESLWGGGRGFMVRGLDERLVVESHHRSIRAGGAAAGCPLDRQRV